MPLRSTALGLRLILPVTIVVLAACFDRVAAPPPLTAPAPRHDFAQDPGWGANNSAESGSWDGGAIIRPTAAF